jgi:hypothetical protein
MQEQQHRLPVIVASDGHPLLDSADCDERSFLYTPGLRLDAFVEENGNSQK